ncbi:MAG TPA: O-antigen ligase family protein, partial [Candidatus Didemnitutus sp.]|nr:O-antigen ligase family protein [Candidatus Didemnitutus sp.]
MSAPRPSHPTSEHGWNAGDWLVTLGLAAMLGWTTLCLGGYRPETMVVTSTAVFALAALAIVWFVIQSRRLRRVALLPAPFLLYALASTWWIAPAGWLAWREWLLWLQMWLVFVLTLHFVRSRGQKRLLTATLVALGIVGSVMALYQRFGDPHWLMLGRTQADQFIGRSSGMFGIPNSLAALLELMIPAGVLLAASRTAARSARVAGGAVAVLFLIALLLTGSRGGWISLTLALSLWPLLGRAPWWKKFVGAAAVLVLAAVTVVALYRGSDFARERIQPFLDGRFESSRPIVWHVGLQIWRGQPWLGTGAGSYNVLFDQHRPRGFLNEPQWTHCDYLNTLSDYGVVGCALWFGAGAWLLGLGWRAVARSRSESESKYAWKLGLWLGCVSFVLHLGVDFHTKIPALAFAFAIVVALLAREETSGVASSRASVAARLAIAAAMFGVLAMGFTHAWTLYRAEAQRFGWR